MKCEKEIDKTKFFRHMIEHYNEYQLLGMTSFIEQFINGKVICELELKSAPVGCSWQKNKGWWIQLPNYQEYMIDDYEVKPFNELATQVTAKFIESQLNKHMKKQFGLKYTLSRKKYFDSKENEIIK